MITFKWHFHVQLNYYFIYMKKHMGAPRQDNDDFFQYKNIAHI